MSYTKDGPPMRYLIAVVVCALTPSASAQTPAPPVSVVREIVLPDGTDFEVATVAEITSKTANKDDFVAMRTVDSVMVGNQVVIAKGAFVRASVADVKRAGHLGHAGTLSLKVESTSAVDGQRVPLRASKAAAGESHMGATVALVILVSPLGFLKHGNDVKYPAGTKITVYTDEPITIKVPQ